MVGIDLTGVDVSGARFVLISSGPGQQPSYWRHGSCSDCVINAIGLPAARHYGIVIPKEAAKGRFEIERSVTVSYDAETGAKSIVIRSSIEIV